MVSRRSTKLGWCVLLCVRGLVGLVVVLKWDWFRSTPCWVDLILQTSHPITLVPYDQVRTVRFTTCNDKLGSGFRVGERDLNTCLIERSTCGAPDPDDLESGGLSQILR